MFDAKYLPAWAKKCCKALHFTPRVFETRNSDQSIDALLDTAVVIVAKNARRTVELTAYDYRYASQYLV